MLREERRLRVFENRVLSRISGLRRDEVTGSGENYTVKSLTLSLLVSYIYGALCKARNFNVYIYIHIWTYVWQR
jgi:hypothetical protein